MQVTGRAVGGPRHGVRLTALPSWDGRIQKNSNTAPDDKRGRIYLDGRYVWQPDTLTWLWVDVRNPDTEAQR